MTPQQAVNWRLFAFRMATETHRWRTDKRRRRVVETVDNLIDICISNWGLALIGDWDGNQINGEGGVWSTDRYGRPHLEIAYPCDEFNSLLSEWGLSHWNDEKCFAIETDFESSVMCCVRAGFDVAVHPSAGVVGSRYTVGMIRRMFPAGLPDWVRAFLDPRDREDLTPFDQLTDDRQVWL